MKYPTSIPAKNLFSPSLIESISKMLLLSGSFFFLMAAEQNPLINTPRGKEFPLLPSCRRTSTTRIALGRCPRGANHTQQHRREPSGTLCVIFLDVSPALLQPPEENLVPRCLSPLTWCSLGGAGAGSSFWGKGSWLCPSPPGCCACNPETPFISTKIHTSSTFLNFPWGFFNTF